MNIEFSSLKIETEDKRMTISGTISKKDAAIPEIKAMFENFLRSKNYTKMAINSVTETEVSVSATEL
jgi:hypothetical protein